MLRKQGKIKIMRKMASNSSNRTSIEKMTARSKSMINSNLIKAGAEP